MGRRGFPSSSRRDSNDADLPTYSSNPPARSSSLFGSMPTPVRRTISKMQRQRLIIIILQGYLNRRPQTMLPSSQMSSRHAAQVLDYTGNRPRVQSMLDGTPSSSARAPTFDHTLQRPPRPRLSERDICPICRRALPPIGPNSDESAREQHIMDCISARDPTYLSESPSQSPAPRPSSTPGQLPSTTSTSTAANNPHPPVYLLPFTATEKDCLPTDSNDTSGPPECSICMVEYEVGDKLARLECLCKFHQECIVGWFRRKRECPVHSMH